MRSRNNVCLKHNPLNRVIFTLNTKRKDNQVKMQLPICFCFVYLVGVSNQINKQNTDSTRPFDGKPALEIENHSAAVLFLLLVTAFSSHRYYNERLRKKYCAVIFISSVIIKLRTNKSK